MFTCHTLKLFTRKLNRKMFNFVILIIFRFIYKLFVIDFSGRNNIHDTLPGSGNRYQRSWRDKG